LDLPEPIKLILYLSEFVKATFVFTRIYKIKFRPIRVKFQVNSTFSDRCPWPKHKNEKEWSRWKVFSCVYPAIYPRVGNLICCLWRAIARVAGTLCVQMFSRRFLGFGIRVMTLCWRERGLVSVRVRKIWFWRVWDL
jgi:hypothetical protein